MHLVEFQQTPCNLRMHPRRRILGNFFLLTTPSAVHLTMCFLLDSHHHKLALKASFAVISASTVYILFIKTFYHHIYLMSINIKHILKLCYNLYNHRSYNKMGGLLSALIFFMLLLNKDLQVLLSIYI